MWKEVELERLGGGGGRREVENEIAVLCLLNHPCIVAYFTHFLTDTHLYIEMDYADGFRFPSFSSPRFHSFSSS